MASLREHFVKDGERNLTTHKELQIASAAGEVLGDFTARLHLDFDANASYISFYFPAMERVACPEAIALNEVATILGWRNDLIVQAGVAGEMKDGRDLVFTGQIYLYSERAVPTSDVERLRREGKAVGHTLTFRSASYAEERNRWEHPRAFISHDSRDKAAIAAPLALELSRLMIPVWYDEFSLKVGDSLRESIEAGLKECHKCILILTPQFLANGGWSKREYDSIFTREIVEKRKLILPIWSDVGVEDVFSYSPILADKVALNWNEGVETVARKLLASI